jgi:hypothetical protein
MLLNLDIQKNNSFCNIHICHVDQNTHFIVIQHSNNMWIKYTFDCDSTHSMYYLKLQDMWTDLYLKICNISSHETFIDYVLLMNKMMVNGWKITQGFLK